MASNIIVMETHIKFLEMALGKMLIGCHNAPYGCQPKGLQAIRGFFFIGQFDFDFDFFR